MSAKRTISEERIKERLCKRLMVISQRILEHKDEEYKEAFRIKMWETRLSKMPLHSLFSLHQRWALELELIEEIAHDEKAEHVQQNFEVVVLANSKGSIDELLQSYKKRILDLETENDKLKKIRSKSKVFKFVGCKQVDGSEDLGNPDWQAGDDDCPLVQIWFDKK